MLKPTRRHFALGAAAALALPATAWSQAYPNKPVRMLVGFAPGGPTDILARIVAVSLGRSLGQSVVVDNRAGAGGAIAAQALAKADPDGYTLLFAGDGQLTLLPQLNPRAGYESLRDFAMVRTVASQSNVLMARRSSGIVSVDALIRQAKAKPGKLSFGSAGNSTPTHLAGVLFEEATQTELLHIPYRGASAAMTDFVGGRLDMIFVGMPVALQYAKDDRFAMLAVTGGQRAAALPQVPTFKEAGVGGLGNEIDVWWAVTAPVGTPPAILQRLDAATRAALDDPALRQSFEQQGVTLTNRDAATTARRVQEDHARWAALVKAGKISAE